MNTTDPTTTNRRPQDADTAPPPPPAAPAKKIDLSLSQTLGGALAAMTAAALGSRLGVAGTITGAAVASIVAGVGGSLYTASLRTTQEKVKTVWSGHVGGSDTKAAVDVVPETLVWDLPDAAESPAAPAPRPASASDAAQPKRQLPWKGMLAGALVVFVITVAALTIFEALSGSALSGGKGTTITQVTKDRKPASKPTHKATTSKSASPSESPSAEDSPSSEPSASTSASASPTEDASEAPSDPATSASSDPTPQQQQEATEEPSATSSATSKSSSRSNASAAGEDTPAR